MPKNKTQKATATPTPIKWVNCKPISKTDYFCYPLEVLCSLALAQLQKYSTTLLHTSAHAVFAKWANGGLTMQESIACCKANNQTNKRGCWGETQGDIVAHYNWLMKHENKTSRFIPIAFINGKYVTSPEIVKQYFNTIV